MGLDIGFMAEARRKLLMESLAIGAVEVVLSVLLLWGIGYFLTRHLKRLTEAGEAMAQGNLAVRVDVRARDEVGQLAAVFNTMARAVEDRLAQMRASEAKFHAIADYSTDCELWLSPTGRLLWINPRVLSLTGYTVEECLDMMAGFPLAIVSAAGRHRAAARARPGVLGRVRLGRDVSHPPQGRRGVLGLGRLASDLRRRAGPTSACAFRSTTSPSARRRRTSSPTR